MSTMINGKSRQVAVRVRLSRYDYLEEKAKQNGDNEKSEVSPEINALIEADYQKNHKRIMKAKK